MAVTSQRSAVLGAIADRIEALPQDHPRRVAIDGVTGTGKTTFAIELAAELDRRGVPVIQVTMDGFHQPRAIRYRQGRGSAAGYYEDAYDFESVRRLLLDPLGPEGDRRYRTAVIDLASDRPVKDAPAEAPSTAVLVVDGSFLQKPNLRSCWDHVVYLHASFEAAESRGVRRDAELLGGTDAAIKAFRTRYHAAQRRYLAECDPAALADSVIDHEDPAAPAILARHEPGADDATADGSSPRATPRVVVVAGPPGAGKSTVAKLLAERIPAPAVCIESDWFWSTIVRGFIPPWEQRADHQNRIVLRSAASAAAVLATGGYDVVIEGVIGPWNLHEVTGPLAAVGVRVDYLVLRPNLAACLARAAGRAGETARVPGHPPLTDSGPVRDLWTQFADLDPFEDHALDTTSFGPVETVVRAAEALQSGALQLRSSTEPSEHTPQP